MQSLNFSPNSRYLYAGTTQFIYQVDLADTLNGFKYDTVAVYDGFKDEKGFANDFSWLTRGPDGKIYTFNGFTKYISYIAKPNKKGKACQMIQHALMANVGSPLLPQYPNYRLGPIDGSPCDTLGIDNHPLADFWWFSDSTFTVEFSDNSSYEPSIWHWTFDDGGMSQDTSPYHTFPAAGIYHVCLTVCNQYSCDTVCKDVNVGNYTSTTEKLEDKIQVNAFPNPTSGTLNIELKMHDNLSRFELFDTVGRKLKSINIWQKGTVNIPLNDLPNGIYFYRLNTNYGAHLGGKVVVNK